MWHRNSPGPLQRRPTTIYASASTLPKPSWLGITVLQPGKTATSTRQRPPGPRVPAHSVRRRRHHLGFSAGRLPELDFGPLRLRSVDNETSLEQHTQHTPLDIPLEFWAGLICTRVLNQRRVQVSPGRTSRNTSTPKTSRPSRIHCAVHSFRSSRGLLFVAALRRLCLGLQLSGLRSAQLRPASPHDHHGNSPHDRTTCGTRAGRPSLEVFHSAVSTDPVPKKQHTGQPSQQFTGSCKTWRSSSTSTPASPASTPDSTIRPPVQRSDHPAQPGRPHSRSAQSHQRSPYHTRGSLQRLPCAHNTCGQGLQSQTNTLLELTDLASSWPSLFPQGQRRYQERAGPVSGTVWSDTLHNQRPTQSLASR